MRVENSESPHFSRQLCKLAPPVSPTTTAAASITISPRILQERKTTQRVVRFLDEHADAIAATEVKIVERIPQEYKESLWYNGQELANIQARDVRENLQFQMLRASGRWPSSSSSSVLLVEAAMSTHNLSWRGLEQCHQTFLGGRTSRDVFKVSDYIQSVLNAADRIKQKRTISYSGDEEQGGNDRDERMHVTEEEELADFALLLSREDSQRASFLGQQDEWMAQELESSPLKRYMVSKESSFSSLLFSWRGQVSPILTKKKHSDNTRSVVLLFVLWLVLLARFSLAN